MSSILDALKKVEAESHNPPKGIAWQRPDGRIQSVHPRGKTARRLNPAALILSGIALLLLLTVFLGPLWVKHAGQESTPPHVSTDPLPSRQAAISNDQTGNKGLPTMPVVSPGNEPAGSTPLTPTPAPESNTSLAVIPTLPSARLQTSGVKPPELSYEPSAPENPAKTVRPDPVKTAARRPSAPLTLDPLLTRKPRDVENSSKSKAPAAQPKENEITTRPYQGDPPIKVQAISWSERPEERLAVINDIIAREGQRVGDIQILRIHPEKIIILKGTNQWAVKFRQN